MNNIHILLLNEYCMSYVCVRYIYLSKRTEGEAGKDGYEMC